MKFIVSYNDNVKLRFIKTYQLITCVLVLIGFKCAEVKIKKYLPNKVKFTKNLNLLLKCLSKSQILNFHNRNSTEMHPNILILTLAMYVNVIKVEDKCNRFNINGQWYVKEVLLTNSGRPHNLVIHKNSSLLFFTFSIMETYLDTGFQISTYGLRTNETKIIKGLPGACAVAIDQANGQVYLGGSEGIYTYNVTTNLVNYCGQKNKNIWSLFFYRYLFYVSYPDQKLHLKIGKQFTKVKEFQHFEVDHFYASVKLIYFANKTGLYRFDRHGMVMSVIKEYISVRQITEDINGVVYVCTNLGVFTLDEKVEGMKLFVDSKHIHGMAFDGDNHVIMSDGRSIFKMVPSDYICHS